MNNEKKMTMEKSFELQPLTTTYHLSPLTLNCWNKSLLEIDSTFLVKSLCHETSLELIYVSICCPFHLEISLCHYGCFPLW